MSKFPSPDEFETSLDAIRDRDKGTPELVAEARLLEPSEASVRDFLTKKAELIQAKREAVNNSPVIVWLDSQHNYQRALKRVLKTQRAPISFPNWVEKTTQEYLRRFLNGDLSLSDDPEPLLYSQQLPADESLLLNFRNFVIGRLYNDTGSWEAKFISSLQRYVQNVAKHSTESRTRSNRVHDDEIAAVELLLEACDDIENRFLSVDASDFTPTLEKLKEKLLFEKSLSDHQPQYIKASDETVVERELMLELWHWFETNKIHVSGRSLHELLSIDGLEGALPDVRSVQRKVSEWRRSHLG